jgi:hypothetical protein
MLVHELFPELARQILNDLRRMRRSDLAAQVMSLHIVDRCRCGSDACGSFYTQDVGSSERRRMPHRGTDIMLECGATVTEVDGMVVEVETLDPFVNRILRRIIP